MHITTLSLPGDKRAPPVSPASVMHITSLSARVETGSPLLFHFPSLSSSHTPCICSIQRRLFGTIIPSCRRIFAIVNNSLLLSTLFSSPQALYPSFILCTTSISHHPFAATCEPRYLKQSTSSIGSPFSLACIRFLSTTASTS